MESKKRKPQPYPGYTDAMKRATTKYNSQFACLTVRILPEKRDALNRWAEEHGTSVRQLINDYIDKLLAGKEEELPQT